MRNSEQEEELAVLEAIYGEDVEVDRDAGTVQVYVPSRTHVPCVVLRALLLPGYPSSEPPALEVHAPHASQDSVSQACTVLEDLFVPGEVIIYTWVQYLKEEAQHLYDSTTIANTAAKNKGRSSTTSSTRPRRRQQPDEHHRTSALLREDASSDDEDDEWQMQAEDGDTNDDDDDSDDDDDDDDDEEEVEGTGQEEGWQEGQIKSGAKAGSSSLDDGQDAALMAAVREKIISGEPVMEKKSTFQAHVAHVTSVSEAKAVIQVLLENNKIRNATHNMMAYRIAHSDAPGVFHQDCDDDGEAAAGGRLMHLLQVADAKNVVVVVSRWFGGVLLGPNRFTVINNTARALLERQGIIKSGRPSGQPPQPTQARKSNSKHKGRLDRH